MAGFFADPTLNMFLRSIPLGRMTAFPGSPLTPEALEKLAASVNG
jgi:hypothetical protein